jgi:hypothetical protein
MNFTWKLPDMKQRQDDYIRGPRGSNVANGNEMHIILLHELRLLRWAIWPMGLLFEGGVVHCFTKLCFVLKSWTPPTSSRFMHGYAWEPFTPSDGDITITIEVLSICFAFMVFEQGNLYCDTLALKMRPWFLQSLHSMTTPYNSLLRKQGSLRAYSNPHSHRIEECVFKCNHELIWVKFWKVLNHDNVK